jgi:hypothetical protein
MATIHVIKITVPDPDGGEYINEMYFHKMPSKLELIAAISGEWKDQNPEKWTKPLGEDLVRTVVNLELPEDYANLIGWYRPVGDSAHAVACDIVEVK